MYYPPEVPLSGQNCLLGSLVQESLRYGDARGADSGADFRVDYVIIGALQLAI